MRPLRPLFAFLILLSTLTAAGAPVRFGGKNCYMGVLHAHTVLSPDFQPQPPNMATFRQLLPGNSNARLSITNGPLAAYKRAADFGKLDFLAITDHVHGPEGSRQFCNHEMPEGGYRLIRDSAARINSDPTYKEKFLAIPGMEWSVIKTGNHVNIFFAEHAVPQNVPNGKYKTLFSDYLDHSDFERGNRLLLVQMNHPNQVPATTAYGRDAFADASGFLNFFKGTYSGIEHINSAPGGNANATEINRHQDGNSLETHYRTYLNMGFRLAPIGDHDNHRPNWGRHTAARTGVWANGLSPAQFVEAYKARRVFATEDNEMAVAFLTGDHWMGSTVEVPTAGELRTFKVFVDQSPDTDSGQLQDEGPYLVEMYVDDVPGGPTAKVRNIMFDGESVGSIYVRAGETVEFTYRVKPGTYCYIHVSEMGGKDSGRKRADAWTAPIFFTSL